MRCAAADKPGRNRVGCHRLVQSASVLTLPTCCRADQPSCEEAILVEFGDDTGTLTIRLRR